MLDQPAYVDRGAKLPLRTPHQKNHAIVSAGLMSALGQKQTCAAHNPMSAVPIADIALSPGSTYSFDVFDGYQAFRGSTLLLFESTVPTSLTQRLCPKASVTERPIALPPELVGACAMQESHILRPSRSICRHAQGAGVKCGLLVSSQPISLTTINARLNVTDANIPS